MGSKRPNGPAKTGTPSVKDALNQVTEITKRLRCHECEMLAKCFRQGERCLKGLLDQNQVDP